ncbi:MAG: hypothetical protein L3J39_16955 [Verrucomicrobiales bacterium]|nr:hypothetical protein [Verrucomicrobiales bacterium]
MKSSTTTERSEIVGDYYSKVNCTAERSETDGVFFWSQISTDEEEVMKLSEYLKSLTEEERDFIAGLDYENDFSEHRKELDRVIMNGGNIDSKKQLWFPYEVVELGENWFQDGHEREFVACAGIVLHNIFTGADQMNDVDIDMDVVLNSLNRIDEDLRLLLEPLLEAAIVVEERRKSNKS